MKRIFLRYFARFYFCKFLTAFFLLVFILLTYKTLESLHNGKNLKNISPWFFIQSSNERTDYLIDIDSSAVAKVGFSSDHLPPKDLKRSCPICLGTSICDSIDLGALKINEPVRDRPTWFQGTWHKTTKVIVKVIDQDALKIYKQFICFNATKTKDCSKFPNDLSIDQRLFSTVAVRNVATLTSKRISDIPPVICVTEKLIVHLKKVFDLDGNGLTQGSELLTLHTAIALNPEALIHVFLAKLSINLPVPYFYGVCGQALVIEDGMTPLNEYLHESFALRANLAVQVLQMVEDFLEEDSDWLFLFSNFTFQNLAIREDGDVVLMDVSNIAIIDKSLIPPDDLNQSNEKLCNEACYRSHTSELYSSKNFKQSCIKISRISHMMYAIVCQNILSNLDEHRNAFAGNSHKVGLLHTLPDKDKQILEDLLQECVKETTSGGRMQATEELKDLLGEYADNDFDGNTDNNHDDDSGGEE